MAMCLKFLTQWNRVSFLNDNIVIAADMHLYTYSTDHAFGGYYQTHWFQGTFPANLLDEGETCSMAFLEL